MKNIFQSPRFWLIVIIAILQSLAVFNVLGGEQVDKLINIISVALGGIVTVRTVDKIGEAKANMTTVSMPASSKKVTATQE